MENKGQSSQLPLAEMKRLLEDCFAPNPWIYWADFLFSCALGYGSLAAAANLPAFSATQALAFVVAVFALYRAVLFTHELTHQDRSQLPGFSVAYNLLAGIPFLVPSFMYRGVHIDHHKKNSYATEEDGEYLPLGASPLWKSVAYVSQSFILPVLLVARFGLIAPLSFLHPRLREFVMKRLSAMAIRTDTPRKIPGPGLDLRNWHILEALSCFYVWGMAYLFYTGTLAPSALLLIYLVVVTAFLVNSLRTVVAHRYRNASGQPLSFQAQLLDSVNIEGNPVIAELVAPVGLRYHALHHLFAGMPYHHLGVAHRRLKAWLPADSAYHQTNEPSLWSAFRTLWRNTRSTEAWSPDPAHHPSSSPQ